MSKILNPAQNTFPWKLDCNITPFTALFLLAFSIASVHATKKLQSRLFTGGLFNEIVAIPKILKKKMVYGFIKYDHI